MRKAHAQKDENGNMKHLEINGNQIFQMVINFFALSFQSMLMGMIVGLTCSMVLKNFNMNQDPIKESTIVLMFAYLSYLIAEQCAFSGIISMFVCGLCMAHYAYYNISCKAQKGLDVTVATVANIAQTFIYIYLGLSLFSIEPEYVNKNFIMVTLASILICRVFTVGVPLLLIYLSTGMKPLALRWNQWVFVYLGGLIRGAIAFALSCKVDAIHSRLLRTTTQICAVITIVGVGSPLQLFAKCFNILPDKELRELMRQRAEENGDDYQNMEGEQIDLNSHSSFHKYSFEDEDEAIDRIDRSFDALIKEKTYPGVLGWFLKLDKKYLMPLFKRRHAKEKKPAPESADGMEVM